MASCTIPSCGRALRDDEAHRQACGRCEHRIRGWLRELPRQLPLLEASLQHDRGPAQGTTHGGRAHSPLPVRQDVLTLLGPGATGAVHDADRDQTGPLPITTTLTSWVQLVAEERHLPGPTGHPTVRQLTQWLATHLDWATGQPWIAELHQELAELLARVRRITHTEPQRHPQDAPCPSCHAFALIEEDWQPYIECTLCELLLTPQEYADHAKRVMPALYRTALALAVQQQQNNPELSEGHATLADAPGT